MFTRILIASDGSDHALAAAHAAAEIARRFDSQVTLVSAFNPSDIPAPFIGVPGAPLMTAVDMGSYVEEVQQAIEHDTSLILESAGVRCQCLRELGHPVDRIVAVAQDIQADLLVMGRRGLSEWKSFLLGSVSDGVVHHAPCPVLVVEKEPVIFQKILLATDGCQCACKAAETAARFATAFQAKVTALHVFEPARAYPNIPVDRHDHEAYACAVLEGIRRDLKSVTDETGVPFCIEQKRGDPAETVVKYAQENDFNLIVMGCRGKCGFESLLLGSVSDRAVHHTHVPVLIVR